MMETQTNVSVQKNFELLLHQMEKRFEAVDKRFEAEDKRFEAMNKRFEDMLHYTDKRFEAVDKRFEDMLHHLGSFKWFIGITTTFMAAILVTMLTAIYKLL